MNKTYKPDGYNDLSTYYLVEGASTFIQFLKDVFDGTELRIYKRPDDTIAHGEIKIGDSVVMVADATAQFKPTVTVVHLYHDNVDAVHQKALAYGCTEIHKPQQMQGEPDKRGAFSDKWGNMWSVGTQQ